jgi:hypothetical protein
MTNRFTLATLKEMIAEAVAAATAQTERASRVSDRSTRGNGQASKVLVPASRMTTARFNAMIKDGKLALPPQAILVAKIVLASKSGLTNAELTAKAGINFHSVDGAVYRLRTTEPPVIKSVPLAK